ncbi:Cyclin N-terminal domain-containing protein [Mycena sanguinolenta]|uniref:Cyclin N-terminal domain-containing protein n=1 Tax=Mycena sanguinolenta TaxID=230812 RepID=A0A8H6Z9E3_9AGAR|nr:Cyclin N-terminal domain-containing protein [Mycena sanguinolenta]
MASTNVRLPLRARPVQRSKADENANSRHVRQSSGIVPPGASRFTSKELVNAKSRAVLSEVTLNRKDPLGKQAAASEKAETGVKRLRSDSTAVLAQRVPLGPGRSQVAPPVAKVVTARVPPTRSLRQSIDVLRRPTRVEPPPVAADEEDDEDELEELQPQEPMSMDVEDDEAVQEEAEEEEPEEVDPMEDSDEEVEEPEEETERAAKPARVWPDVSTERALQYQREVQAIRDTFQDDVDISDTNMVSEYAEDIFEYMSDLEEKMMPNADYMSHQNEITWAMRQTLVDWLLQVHLRYRMLPETLWIAVNIIDRFLTHRAVSLIKLQLVGITAMFIAAKYEEILAPSVEEFVFMAESGYTKEEILKGERIMLQTLEFRISHYCSPYSWMRKISKADDYNIQTRTLSKFLTEVTLLDYRFLRAKPSLIAAVGMYSSRRMLDGDWNEAFVFYSGYTEEQLVQGHDILMEKLTERNFPGQYVYKKYSHRKFLKASKFAVEWAKVQINGGAVEAMMLEE